MSRRLEFRRETLDSAVARELVEALNAELSRTYPEPGATHFRLEAHEIEESHGAFLVAYEDGHAVACGAVRGIEPGSAEIKRMYVKPDRRGTGVGRQLMKRLEAAARSLGATRLVLETGVRQHAALALYEREGFARIPCFGEYAGSPLSICMGKDLR